MRRGSLVGLLTVLVVAGVAMAMVVGLVRLVEPGLAFFPLRGEDETPAQYGIQYTPLTIATADGETVHGWHLPRPDALAQIVYFHGNGGNLSIWSHALVGLWRQRYEVIALDYRGYGLSTGRPSEQGLYRDVDATVGFVHDRLRRADLRVIYWGRSLGATMAAYAAASHAPDGVVLEAGFPSARAVLETNPVMWLLSWASSYQFPTTRWMTSVRAPTLVLHGDADSVIPYRLGQRLYNSIPGPKRFVTIAGGDHNDAEPRSGDAYWDAIAAFVQSIPPPR